MWKMISLGGFGRSPRRQGGGLSGRVALGEPETSSIGDMAFLLLIFFIVTSSFMMKMGIFLSLPSASGSTHLPKSEIFEITPLEEGFLVAASDLSGGRPMGAEEAYELLAQKKAEVDNPVFVVYMEPQVSYQRFIDALTIAGRAGVKRISIKDIEADR